MLKWAAWTAAGVLIGFGTGFAAMIAAAIVVPHCGIACDDTVPELVAAVAAYGTWALTVVTTSVLAWRDLSLRP